MQCIGIVLGHTVAGTETTANGISNVLWLLAQHPERWAAVRDEPGLATSTVRECLRLESPVQWFSRVTTQEAAFGDITLPAGTRSIHNYGSANRDERHYADAEWFDIRRDPQDALSFGFGVHNCPGQYIANLEIVTLLIAMTRRIVRFELTGQPERRINNLTRGLRSLPVRVCAP